MAEHEKSIVNLFGERNKIPANEIKDLIAFVEFCMKPEVMKTYNNLRDNRANLAREYEIATNFVGCEFNKKDNWAIYTEYMNLRNVIDILDENHSTFIRYKTLYSKIVSIASDNHIKMDILHIALSDKIAETNEINSCGCLFSRNSPIQWARNHKSAWTSPIETRLAVMKSKL